MTNKDSFLESKLTRRNFISNSGKLATGGALAGIALPVVHGQSSDITKIALVGCGGRGMGQQAMLFRFLQPTVYKTSRHGRCIPK